ncbi:MAG: hypothetical protein H7Z42_16330 [Roseiflexaceae bacterium]|nr:hypothetical protein [Roseiflexaceae bacterium]
MNWNTIQIGGGYLIRHEHGLRLLTTNARRERYADAQIDDYRRLSRRHFPWRAPLRMSLRARASGPITGTAGFGFWNNPLTPIGGVPALPAAIWFFHASPPSHLPLAQGGPASGWMCMTIDATTPRALRWAPLAPLVLLANRLPGVQRRLWPLVQRDLRITMVPVAAPTYLWHTYTLEWQAMCARFWVDDALVFETPTSPRSPLGFVAWVDNQCAVATPRGRLGWELLDAPGLQWLDIDQLQIEPQS